MDGAQRRLGDSAMAGLPKAGADTWRRPASTHAATRGEKTVACGALLILNAIPIIALILNRSGCETQIAFPVAAGAAAGVAIYTAGMIYRYRTEA